MAIIHDILRMRDDIIAAADAVFCYELQLQ
jgi:hypothetical protein